MKMLLFVPVAIMVALVTFAHGAEWYPANQSTLAWDQNLASTNPDGTTFTIPETQMSYRVYRCVMGADKATAEFLGHNTAKQFLVKFYQEGQFYLGVQAVRTIPGVENPIVSAIAWSDAAEHTHDKPFGVSFFTPPMPPQGIKVD